MKYTLVNKDIRSDYVKELLKERGIQDVESFLRPTITNLENWSSLKGIGMAAGVLMRHLTSDDARPIALIVDSDLDGFTSAAIFYLYVKHYYPEQEITPFFHRGKQHGLEDTWERISEGNFKLLMVIDAGSNDAKYVEKLGIETIVLDHHLVEDTNFPLKMYVVNNQLSPEYENKDLSGAGVAWQFCRAIDAFAQKENYAWELIDLAAVGICGDAMSALSIENQYIWREGFAHIKNPFLKAIIEKQSYSMNGKVNPITVAFYVVPLVNAMVRVGSQEEKERMFQAFINGDALIPSKKRGAGGTLEKVAVESTRECVNARAHQNKMLDAAQQELEIKIFNNNLLDNKILIVQLDEEDFPSELNGLLAMRLADKYKHPTIVARLNDQGYIRGSMRGVNNSPMDNFKEFLTNSGYCEYVLGHAQAAGVSMKAKNVPKLHEFANSMLRGIKFDENSFDVNFIRHAADKDIATIIGEVARYEDIWGTGNSEPVFYVSDINLTQNDIQIIGKNSDTVKFAKFGVVYIKFHAEQLIKELKEHKEIKMEVVGRGNVNEWMGNVTYQIMIDGYEIHDGTLSF